MRLLRIVSERSRRYIRLMNGFQAVFAITAAVQLACSTWMLHARVSSRQMAAREASPPLTTVVVKPYVPGSTVFLNEKLPTPLLVLWVVASVSALVGSVFLCEKLRVH